ncbi:MAG: efflux RND transporter periplasmic adaptor subunit [Roseibium sp.]
MIIFLTLCYCGILFALVKAGIIKLNTFWKISPVLWLVLLLVVLFIPMQWGAPSGPTRSYNKVIEIVPNVNGTVVDVPVRPLVLLAEGDVLFQIDPEPFEAVVDRAKASLAEANQVVPQLGAAVDAAEAGVKEAEALRDRSKDDYDRFRTANENAIAAGQTSTPFSESDVEQRRLTFLASEATVLRTLATAKQANLAYASEIDGVNTTVARAEADLRKAEFDLRETTVRAPEAGYVAALSLRPGQRVSNLPLRSWMAFIPLSERRIVVAIPQTRLRYVKPDQPVEVTFSFRPGQVYPGKVETSVPLASSGQLPPNGLLPSLSSLAGPNETFAVIIDIDNLPMELDALPGGSGGTAAIYTQSVQPTHLIRKVMIRMDAWLNYIRPN